MTKILVKNGDWDKARADLGTMLDAKKNNFDAQFEAAFGARKPAETAAPPANSAAKPAAAKVAPGVILSRPRGR